jgi:DNA-binding transcriptional LysR family regulator
MEWSDVRFFLEVSRAGSLGSAARKLKVDQTTVARRLKALEDALATTLFERTPEGVALTAAGEAIREAGAQMEEAAMAVERRATGADGRAAGTVRLTTTDLLGARVVVPAVERLREEHPGIDVEMLTGPQLLDIGRREADVAIRLGRPGSSQLVGRKLGTLGYGAYGSVTYLAAHPAGAPEEGLAGHSVVAYDESIRPAADMRIAGVQVRGARLAFRTNSPLVLLSAISAGWGVGEVACYLGDEHPGIARAWPDLAPYQVDIWLLTHPDLHRTARVRAVMDALLEAFHEHAAALRGERVLPRPARAAAPTAAESVRPIRHAGSPRRKRDAVR